MENKRKLLLYRSVHRGCKETDILLGRFAEKNINSLTREELSEYEAIVAMDDSKLYHLLVAGNNPHNLKLINEIIAFNQQVGT